MPANDTAGDEREADRIRVSDYRNNRISNVYLLCAAFDRLLTAAEYERDALAARLRAAESMADARADALKLADEANVAAEDHANALAAKLAEAERKLSVHPPSVAEACLILCRADLRAAIARAEAAEATVQALTHQCEERLQGWNAAEKRAAALAEALRYWMEAWDEFAARTGIGHDEAPSYVTRARAALAGNGTAGDGWIACETDLNPTPYERVLAIVEGDVVIASYSGPHRSAIDGRMRPLWSTSPRQPTHWRPLPAPPSANEKETT